MNRQEKVNALSAAAFLLTTFVIAPAGFLISRHLSNNSLFQQESREHFDDIERAMSLMERSMAASAGKVGENSRDIDLVRQRINKMESRIYDISRSSP